MRSLLLALGAAHAALGAFMVISPQTFYDELAGYPPYNDHFIRDIATYNLAFGAAFITAAARSSWQIPVLALAAIQYTFHAVNHVWDVADTEPAWQGPVNLVGLGLVTAGLWWLLRRTRRALSGPRADGG
jgi:hypothetical protein